MMQSNIKIAITGGICSGKSTVAETIARQGFKVFSCDKIYAELLNDSSFANMLESNFGGIKRSDGSIDRSALAETVFGDTEQLKKLNALTHPAIMQRAFERMKEEKICFLEVPLLFEGGYETLFDGVIVVLRDRSVRINELMQRSKISENQAILRINSQYNYENGDFVKYYVIHNSGDLSELEHMTVKTLNKIKNDLM